MIIQGDLNARTGDLEDTLSPDKSDETFEISLGEPPSKRHSLDTCVDQRGNDLINMCKSLDLNIVNGRKTGDVFGDYTRIKYNGISVVDYVITSPSTFSKISTLKVGKFTPWLSDHCPISYVLEIQRDLNGNIAKESATKTKAPRQYIRTEKSKKEYLDLISTSEFNSLWDKNVEIDHSNPNLLVNHAT